MLREPDLLILGAGPAGVGAALAARHCGLETVIIDAEATSGGQVYRAMPTPFQSLPDAYASPDRRMGEQQRQALAESGVTTAFGRLVWSVGQDFRVDAVGPSGPEHWCPKALLIAAGAYERVTPFPGWTLPGVMGLAAATILLKSQLILPGQRTLVAGSGPLLALVAYTILQHGGEVVGVLDLASRGDWLQALPALLTRPAESKRGLNWRWQLHAAKVPWLYRHSIQNVQSSSTGLVISAGSIRSDGSPDSTAVRHFEADCVTVGHGLVPSTEITRLLGVEHVFRRELGGWVPVLDDDQRTGRDGLYAAGDGCGIRGAAMAHQSGYIAGYAAALDQGKIGLATFRQLTAKHRQEQRRTARFSKAMSRLMAQRSGQVRAIAADTIVCRCEDITRAEIEQSLEQGAQDVNQLKSWTRCGMGPCQGRICGDTVAELLAARCGGREQAGIWTARAPLRPLDVAAFTGEFNYSDIPIPKAAPL